MRAYVRLLVKSASIFAADTFSQVQRFVYINSGKIRMS
jgi:hypothetical protein